jgi:glutaminyl-peptide cyclotransferase
VPRPSLTTFLFSLLAILSLTACTAIPTSPFPGIALRIPGDGSASSLNFNGTRAFGYLESQCAFGPRPPGSDNLTRCGDYLISLLQAAGWSVQTQNWTFQNTPLRNIVAGAHAAPQLVLLAHYDTRPYADREPSPANRTRPILGASDGASGVAALLELAAALPPTARNAVALVFVDAEDSGNLNGWPWILGSTYYVSTLSASQRSGIRAAIVLDMIGDADLQLKRETQSSALLVNDIWQIGADLNYSNSFLNVVGWTLTDDHVPFLQAGIPAADIIDFDYPYWHTLADTPDKCSSTSLQVVGRVVEEYVTRQLATPTTYTSPLSQLVWGVGIAVALTVIAAGLSYWVVGRRQRHRRASAARS